MYRQKDVQRQSEETNLQVLIRGQLVMSFPLIVCLGHTFFRDTAASAGLSTSFFFLICEARKKKKKKKKEEKKQ